MDKRTILAAAIGLIVGATGGFLVVNGLNRSELTELRGKAAQNSNLSENGVRPHDDLTIGDDEIRSKIAQADADLANFNYQKDLGGALYRYASMKNDSKLAAEALRILERAYSLLFMLVIITCVAMVLGLLGSKGRPVVKPAVQ